MGGLGFRDIKDFNTALLAKQCWKMFQPPNSLVSRILKAKYFPHCDFFKASVGRNSSYVWRSLLSARDLLLEGGMWRIGDGWDADLWGHPWLPNRPGGRIFGPAPENMIHAKVGEFIDHATSSWDVDKLNSHFSEAEVADILKVKIPSTNCADKFCWPAGKFGEYSVKGGYRWLRELKGVESVDKDVFKAIWRCCLPPKLKHFAWRISKGILPTTSALHARMILDVDRCLICNVDGEDSNHALALCGWASAVWNGMGMNSTPLNFQSSNCVMEWMREMATNHEYGNLERGTTTMWMLWNSRNNKVFNNAACNGDELPTKVEHYLLRYKDVIQTKEKVSEGTKQTWQPPPDGLYKLNCDGSFRIDGRCGLGAVIRAGDQAMLGAMAAPIEHCLTAKEIEAVAIRAGLAFARDCGFDKVLVESDASEIIAEINRPQPSLSLHGHVVEDIKQLVNYFSSCSFKLIPCYYNFVANRLANIGASKIQPLY